MYLLEINNIAYYRTINIYQFNFKGNCMYLNLEIVIVLTKLSNLEQ